MPQTQTQTHTPQPSQCHVTVSAPLSQKFRLPRYRLQNNMAAQKRAAPFKDPVGNLVSSPRFLNMFPQQKEHSALGKEQGYVPSDLDLLSTTVKRVSELEARVRLQTREIELKDQEIAALEQKLKKLQKQRTGHSSSEQHVQELENRCQELQKQISDMEHFLSDYGLIWVGDDDSTNTAEQKTTGSSSGLSSNTFQPDYDLIIENLRDLNVLGGEGVSQIQYSERAARLKPPDPILLTLYKNGIIMFQGPFRSYEDPSTRQCLKDIMDGYFPSELQTRFPEGVTFQVKDLRDVVFRERRSWDEFPGAGQTIGGTEGNVRETSKLPGHQLSVDQFLSRLPKSVVRGGQVLDIQGPIREALQGSKGEKTEQILVDSPHVLSMEKSSQTDVVVCTLRVKSENGEDTYRVRMLSSETLGDLRNYLSQHRTTEEAFNIINRLPYQVYENNECTLQEAALVPNAFLLLRRKP
ncbi:PREDICTED: UBX domain-containing protein 11 [Nanorana parkeri]|uniref:UBX domain-containing protein 11 n=1 Tax=Nanorana parkeri TaxID=125878 RepID=UPI000854B12A|nr:PREDICTED: UBX domain-containing protein 11 [Nanorana parkeri]